MPKGFLPDVCDRKAKVGETLKQHFTGMYKNPHHMEGFIYSYQDDLIMMTQVGYEKFSMISLLTGNRYEDPVKGRDGLVGEEAFESIFEQLLEEFEDATATYIGTAYDVVRKSILKKIGK